MQFWIYGTLDGVDHTKRIGKSIIIIVNGLLGSAVPPLFTRDEHQAPGLAMDGLRRRARRCEEQDRSAIDAS